MDSQQRSSHGNVNSCQTTPIISSKGTAYMIGWRMNSTWPKEQMRPTEQLQRTVPCVKRQPRKPTSIHPVLILSCWIHEFYSSGILTCTSSHFGILCYGCSMMDLPPHVLCRDALVGGLGEGRGHLEWQMVSSAPSRRSD
jgi:hypothetical protein